MNIISRQRACAHSLIALVTAGFMVCTARADIDLRVESRPIVQAIDAYVLVTDGESPIAGLAAGDFSITLDGMELKELEFSLPPSQDPSQSVSIVVVAQADDYPPASVYTALIDALDVGDHVSVVKYQGDIEMSRSGGVEILPFTQVDGGAGSAALKEFLQSPLSQSIGGRRCFSTKRCWRAWVNSRGPQCHCRMGLRRLWRLVLVVAGIA